MPDLLPYEMANVLRYKPDWGAGRVAQAMDSFFALRLEVSPISLALIQRAVALAEENNASFFTADEKLVRSLKGMYKLPWRELKHLWRPV